MTGLDKRAETDASLATLLIRVGIGLLFFFAGINKMFFHKVLTDGSSLSGPFGWAADNIENFSKTWLPGILLYPFSYSLPFVELILGRCSSSDFAHVWSFLPRESCCSIWCSAWSFSSSIRS